MLILNDLVINNKYFNLKCVNFVTNKKKYVTL